MNTEYMITNLVLPIREEKRRKKKMQIGSNIHNNQRASCTHKWCKPVELLNKEGRLRLTCK
jgi:hypothetical protein